MANFKVVSGALNVRTGPSLSERTVGTIQAGDVVAQLPASAFEPPANGIVTEVTARHPVVRTWLKVDDGEIEGWTSLKNLTEQPDGNFLVTVDSNVRLEPFIPSATAPSNFVGSEP